jgi:ABC-type lipoprotein release transport system permease subunit
VGSGPWLWARAELRRGWWSLAVAAVLVALSSAAVLAGVAGARRASAAVDRYVAAAEIPEVRMFRQAALDGELRGRLEADPRVEALIELQVILATPTSLRPGEQGATLVGGSDYWGDVTAPRLISGRYPSGADEIALSENARERTGLRVGERVDLHLLPLKTLERCDVGGCDPTPTGKVTISGVVRMQEDLEPHPNTELLFLADRPFMEARGGDTIVPGHITDVDLVAGADVDGFVAELSTLVTDGNVNTAAVDVAGARHAGDLQRDALLIGAAVVAAAGLLIIVQAFGRHLSRRSGDPAVLSAMGMSYWQRTVAGWIPGAAGGVAGALLSIPLAIAASPLFPLRTPRRADPAVGFHADVLVLVAGVTAVAIISSAAALFAAAMWSRLVPATGQLPPVSAAARLANALRLPPSAAMGMRFALEPGRGSRRTPVIPALAGAVTALTVIVGALVLSSSLDGLLESPDRFGAPWDFQLSGVDDSGEVTDAVASDARIAAAALLLPGELNVVSADGVPTQVVAIGLQQLKGSIDPVALEGRAPLDDDELLVGSDTLAALGIDIGDRVVVSGPRGTQRMIVVGRGIVPIVGGISTGIGIVGDFARLSSLGAGELIAEVDADGTLVGRTRTPADIESLRADLEESRIGLETPSRQPDVTVLDEVRTVPKLVVAFTAALGGLAVLHALVVTGRRRRRDLAVLRALGCRPRQVGDVICWQGGVFALCSVAVGVPLGLIVGRVVWRSVAINTDVLPVVDVPWPVIVGIAVAAIAGAAAVLAIGPAAAATRRRPGPELWAE